VLCSVDVTVSAVVLGPDLRWLQKQLAFVASWQPSPSAAVTVIAKFEARQDLRITRIISKLDRTTECLVCSSRRRSAYVVDKMGGNYARIFVPSLCKSA